MANIVLISLHQYVNREPLGIRYLFSCLNQSNHNVSIIVLKKYQTKLKRKVTNYTINNYHEIITPLGDEVILSYPSIITNKERSLLLELLYKLKPDFIGFTLSTIELENVISLTNMIKSEFKNISIVWGGIEPTMEPDKCIKIADTVCIGEGEGAVVDLANTIDQGKEFSDIKNLWVREDGKIIKNELRPLIQNLDALPFPDMSYDNRYLIEDDKITQLEREDFWGGNYDIMTSRGCPFSCSYCFNNHFKGLYPNQKYLRRRSPENVINELKLAKIYRKPDYIEFQDDVFTFNQKWVEEFCILYKKEVGIYFGCYAHPLISNRKVLELLRGTGLLNTIVIGIQSGSMRVLQKIYNRHTPSSYILESVNMVSDISPKTIVDLITDNPLENEKDCKDTLELLLKISCHFICDISKLSVFPNYDIAYIFKQRGLIPRVDKMYRFEEDKLHSFYNKLYLLTQSKLPRNWIRKLSENRFLMNHQWLFKFYFLPYKYYRLTMRITKLMLKALVPNFIWESLKKVKHRPKK